MRSSIEIDDQLMAQAMRASGRKTERETVEYAFKLLVQSRRSAEAIRALRGKVEWDGDLDTLRRDR
jgi:Arc/MetJ family transcription regulator